MVAQGPITDSTQEVGVNERDYCHALEARVNQAALTALVEEIAPRVHHATINLCVLCSLNPATDMWPRGWFQLGNYRVCLRCAEKHGT